MEPHTDSLLKYDTPALVTPTTDNKSPRARPLQVSPQQLVFSGPVPPPPKPKSPPAKTEELLNAILPPREWMEDNQRWVQQVSSTPATRMDVVDLQEQLELKLQQRHAREQGICPVRSELYSQCFDELIRQITINCPERGLLLLRVRDEIRMTNNLYQALHASGMSFGIRKALQAEQEPSAQQGIADLENKNQDLERQVNEQKAKCEEIEMQDAEWRQVEEKQHTAQIQLLKRSNQQLKAHLEKIITAKKGNSSETGE